MFSKVNTRGNSTNSSNVLRKRAHKDSLFPRPEEIRIPTASITAADCLLLYTKGVRPRTRFSMFLWFKVEQEALSWDWCCWWWGGFHHPVDFSAWFEEECRPLFSFVERKMEKEKEREGSEGFFSSNWKVCSVIYINSTGHVTFRCRWCVKYP